MLYYRHMKDKLVKLYDYLETGLLVDSNYIPGYADAVIEDEEFSSLPEDVQQAVECIDMQDQFPITQDDIYACMERIKSYVGEDVIESEDYPSDM